MDPLASSVAVRHVLARDLRAGVFEAPPAMLISVGSWIRSIYAGHVLESVEARLDNVRDRTGVLDGQLAEMQASLASCEREIRVLKPGQTARYKMYLGPTQGWIFIGTRPIKNSYYDPEQGTRVHLISLGESPLKPKPHYQQLYEMGRGKRALRFEYEGSRIDVDEAVRRIRVSLEGGIKRLEAFRSKQTPRKTDGSKLVEIAMLRRECLRWVDEAKSYTSVTKRKFPIDLRGWKYLHPNSPIVKRVNERIVARNATIRNHVEVAHKTYALAVKAFDLAQGNEDWEKDPKIRAIMQKLNRNDWLEDGRQIGWDSYFTRSAIHQNKRPAEPMVFDRSSGRVPAKEIEKQIEPLLGPDDIVRALAHENWDEIVVSVNFIGHKTSVGTWRAIDRSLVVDIRGEVPSSVDQFRDTLKDILRTTRHELQHLGQDLLTRIQGLKQEAGSPSYDIRVKAPEGAPRKEHALREEEFYTRLADEIEEFAESVARKPAADVRGSLDFWVTKGSEFFRKLRVHEPLKWQKAVKEFMKGLEARGITL